MYLFGSDSEASPVQKVSSMERLAEPIIQHANDRQRFFFMVIPPPVLFFSLQLQ
jgi:hypothetical protein